jgi:hypothetical protein
MKDNLPYFSHDNNARRNAKMRALINTFGPEGYGRFWMLNEMIAESSGAFIDISKKLNKHNVAEELKMDIDGLDKFIAFLSDPEVDLINNENGKITTNRVTELFKQAMETREYERNKKRKKGKAEIPEGNDNFPDGFPGENEEFPQEKDTDKIREDKIKQDKTREEEIKQDNSGSAEPPDEDSSSEHNSSKKKKPPLREREPVNDCERVEKAYLQNWDALYANGQVQTLNPVVNWNQTRKLLKNHFEKQKLKPEQIIQAINNGLKDSWIMKSGYSLSMMLTTTRLNSLINSGCGDLPVSNQPIKEGGNLETLWNKARECWNKLGLKPECRDVIPKESEIQYITRTFQNYTWEEIENAINNYDWHKNTAGPEYRPPPEYLSLSGFMKNGVEKYFEDNAVDQLFKEEKK